MKEGQGSYTMYHMLKARKRNKTDLKHNTVGTRNKASYSLYLLQGQKCEIKERYEQTSTDENKSDNVASYIEVMNRCLKATKTSWLMIRFQQNVLCNVLVLNIENLLMIYLVERFV